MTAMKQINSKEKKSAEIEKNYEVFLKMLPSLLAEHRGKYALMRQGEVVSIYTTVEDAVETGEVFYEDDMFSVQKITNEDTDLGFYSHAVYLG